MSTSYQPVDPVVPLEENPLKELKNYEVIILMDDSTSMYGARWEHAEKVMKGLVVEAVKYDQDGIEIQFLNSREKSEHTKTEADVSQLFTIVRPSGTTPLGPRLGNLCEKYLESFKKAQNSRKRCLIIAITDGAPDTEEEVRKAIKTAAKDLDELAAPRTQLGIQFVQIGSDAGAKKFLTELDSTLASKNGMRDIVDTTIYSGSDLTYERLLKILAGAINKKVDRSDETST